VLLKEGVVQEVVRKNGGPDGAGWELREEGFADWGGLRIRLEGLSGCSGGENSRGKYAPVRGVEAREAGYGGRGMSGGVYSERKMEEDPDEGDSTGSKALGIFKRKKESWGGNGRLEMNDRKRKWTCKSRGLGGNLAGWGGADLYRTQSFMNLIYTGAGIWWDERGLFLGGVANPPRKSSLSSRKSKKIARGEIQIRKKESEKESEYCARLMSRSGRGGTSY